MGFGSRDLLTKSAKHGNCDCSLNSLTPCSKHSKLTNQKKIEKTRGAKWKTRCASTPTANLRFADFDWDDHLLAFAQ